MPVSASDALDAAERALATENDIQVVAAVNKIQRAATTAPADLKPALARAYLQLCELTPSGFYYVNGRRDPWRDGDSECPARRALTSQWSGSRGPVATVGYLEQSGIIGPDSPQVKRDEIAYRTRRDRRKRLDWGIEIDRTPVACTVAAGDCKCWERA